MEKTKQGDLMNGVFVVSVNFTNTHVHVFFSQVSNSPLRLRHRLLHRLLQTNLTRKQATRVRVFLSYPIIDVCIFKARKEKRCRNAFLSCQVRIVYGDKK